MSKQEFIAIVMACLAFSLWLFATPIIGFFQSLALFLHSLALLILVARIIIGPRRWRKC